MEFLKRKKSQPSKNKHSRDFFIPDTSFPNLFSMTSYGFKETHPRILTKKLDPKFVDEFKNCAPQLGFRIKGGSVYLIKNSPSDASRSIETTAFDPMTGIANYKDIGGCVYLKNDMALAIVRHIAGVDIRTGKPISNIDSQ